MNDLNNGPVVITSEIHHEEQQHRATTNVADQLGASPYSNITVGRAQTNDQYASPMRVPVRNSISSHPRPKQKVRKPSRQWLENKSGKSNRKKLSFKYFSFCRRIWIEYGRYFLVETRRRTTTNPSDTLSILTQTHQSTKTIDTRSTSVNAHESHEIKSIESRHSSCTCTQLHLTKHPHSWNMLRVSQTNSFRQTRLSLSIVQCSVSYGLQGKLRNTLFAER